MEIFNHLHKQKTKQLTCKKAQAPNRCGLNISRIAKNRKAKRAYIHQPINSNKEWKARMTKKKKNRAMV